MKTAKKSAVLYHYPCPDGAFAALAAYLYFRATSLPVAFFPNTVYEPIKAENLPTEDLSDVYLLDFVGPSGFVAEISSKVDRWTKGKKGGFWCSGLDFGFSARSVRRQEVRSFPPAKKLLALDPDLIIAHGQDTLLHKQELIDKVLEQSYEISLGCGRFGCCLAVDADSVSNLRSELGHQLADKSRNLKLRGIGAVVYKMPELNNDQILKISLRSLGSEDTTPISQEYGGGGHRNASSFMLSVEEFERWKVGTESEC